MSLEQTVTYVTGIHPLEFFMTPFQFIAALAVTGTETDERGGAWVNTMGKFMDVHMRVIGTCWFNPRSVPTHFQMYYISTFSPFGMGPDCTQSLRVQLSRACQIGKEDFD